MTTSRRGFRWAALLGAGALLLAHTAGFAEEITVPGNYASLEQAIRAAKPGDRIVVTQTKTFRDNIQVRSKRRITITTNSKTRLARIEATSDESPALSFSSCSDIVFENFIIQSGSVGVFASDSANLTFRNCTVTQNVGSGFVGSAFVLDSTTVTKNGGWGLEIVAEAAATKGFDADLVKATVSDNPAGGIRIQGTRVNLESTTIQGSLGWGVEVKDRGTLTMERGQVESTIQGHGLGGIHVVEATATLTARVAANGHVACLAEGSVLNLAGAVVSGHSEGNLIYRDSTGAVSESEITGSLAFGLSLQGQSSVTLAQTTVSGHGQHGITVDSTSRLALGGGTVVSGNALDGVLVSGGTLTTSGAQITENVGNGLVGDTRAQLALGTSTIEANAANGISLSGATLALDRCEVKGNGEDGVRAVGGSTLTISNGSLLASNAGNGLSLDASTGGLTQSQAQANQGSGLSAANRAQATVKDSTVSRNLAQGLLVVGSRLEVQGSQVRENQRNGICVRAGSVLVVGGGRTTVTLNAENGILIEASEATLENSEVSENDQSGVSLSQASEATLSDATVSKNLDQGLLAVGSQLGVANSEIRENGRNGIYVQADSVLTVGGGKTRITQNGENGILVEGSKATVNDCEIWENLRRG